MAGTMNKQQYIKREIARQLLVMRMEGTQRLPAVTVIARQYGVGLGTVQGALNELRQSGAIEINACGAQGSYLENSVPKLLWKVSEYGDLIGLLPLDMDQTCKALATGIYEALSRYEIPFHLLFARGSRNRIGILERQKCDFAVMSRMAYDYAVDVQGKKIESIGDIGQYPSHPGCITLRDHPYEVQKTPIAFDHYSYDQRAICETMKMPALEQEGYLGVQLPGLVEMGEVPAALCDCAMVPENGKLEFHALEERLPETMLSKLRQAVVAVRQDNDILARLLKLALTKENVGPVQRETLEGARLIKY